MTEITEKDDSARTGIFYVKEPPGIVVMLDGREVARYKSRREFIEAHVKGAAALQREMDEHLASHYRPEGPR